MHSKQTGNTGPQAGTGMHRNLVSYIEYTLIVVIIISLCLSGFLLSRLSTEVDQSLLVFVALHLAPSLPLVPRTPGAGLEAADVSTLCWWRSSSPRYIQCCEKELVPFLIIYFFSIFTEKKLSSYNDDVTNHEMIWQNLIRHQTFMYFCTLFFSSNNFPKCHWHSSFKIRNKALPVHDRLLFIQRDTWSLLINSSCFVIQVSFQHESYPVPVAGQDGDGSVAVGIGVCPGGEQPISRQVFIVQELEVRDRLASSQINKFLYLYTSESMPRRAHSNMVRCREGWGEADKQSKS